MAISTLGWIIVGGMAWMVVAAVVGVLVGRAVRLRDRQVPRPPCRPGTPARAVELPEDTRPGRPGSEPSRFPRTTLRGPRVPPATRRARQRRA